MKKGLLKLVAFSFLVVALASCAKVPQAEIDAAKAAIDAANKAIAEAQTIAKKTTEMAKQGVAELKKHAPSAAPKASARRKARA